MHLLRCFCCVFVIGLSHQLQAQKRLRTSDDYREGLHIGYRADFGGYKEYKGVKQYYNQKRPWLDNTLAEKIWMNGFDIGLGTQSNFGGATILNIGFATRRDKASGLLPSGESFSRTIRIKQFSIDAIDAWWTPVHAKGFDFGFGMMPLGIMWTSFSTKIDGEKPEFGPFKKNGFRVSQVLFNMDLYTSVHLDLVRGSEDLNSGVRFQFFYFIGWKSETNDLILLNQELNPNTYQDYHQRTLLRNSHFGIKTSFFI